MAVISISTICNKNHVHVLKDDIDNVLLLMGYTTVKVAF